MCGVLAIFGGAVDDRAADRMIDAMADRGPDGRGRRQFGPFLLGHRRLAITDARGGPQPMSTPDGRFAVSYNGQLYNNDALRGRLRREAGWSFRTRCDTETVLAAWAVWGPDCLRRMRGSFGLAAVDAVAETGMLARDPCGVKPMFFAHAGRSLAAASAVAALLEHPGVPRRPNDRTVSHYLGALRTTLGRETMYDSVHQLLPGERLLWRDGRIKIDRHWSLPDSVAPQPFAEAVTELADGLDDAVAVRLAGDRKVGLFLSGGVDSAAIAASLADAGRGIDARTSAQEAAPAARTAELVGGETEVVPLDADGYRAAWRDLASATRLPCSTPSDPVILALSRSMKRTADVVLSGEGADELLYGYAAQHGAGLDLDAEDGRRLRVDAAHATSEMLRDGARRLARPPAACGESLAAEFLERNSLVPPSRKASLLTADAWRAAEQDRAAHARYAALLKPRSGEGAARRTFRLLHAVNLEGQLARLDAAAMRASLEVRAPFTDPRLTERAASLPASAHIRRRATTQAGLSAAGAAAADGYETKRVLRAAADRRLPAEVTGRRKVSFATPAFGWLADEWAAESSATVARSPFLRSLLRPEAIAEVATRPAANAALLWPLINLAEWGDREF